MANKTDKKPATEAKAPLVMTHEIVASAILNATPNPDVATAPIGATYTVTRGRVGEAGKFVYVTAITLAGEGTEPVVGDIVGSVMAAHNSALTALGLIKGTLGMVVSLKDLFPAASGDNGAPAFELTPEDVEFANDQVNTLGESLSETAALGKATRAVHVTTAQAVHALRSRFADKKAWSVVFADVLRKASEPVAELLAKPATVSLYTRFYQMSQYDFFNDLPESLRMPRSVEKVVGEMRTAIGNEIVRVITSEKRVKIDGKAQWERVNADGEHASLKSMGLTMAVRTLLAEHLDPEQEYLGFTLKDDAVSGACLSMIAAHVEKWDRDGFGGDLFEYGEGKDVVVVKDGPRAIFGLEGPDELLTAIVRAFQNEEATRSTSKAVNEMGDAVSALDKEIKAGNAFSGFTTIEAASHLMGILAAKAKDKDNAGSGADMQAVVDQMSAWVAGFSDGELTKADLVEAGSIGNAPSEEDADEV